MICEKCGREHDGSFGSGRFCSRSCANSRNFSEETNKKRSSSNRKASLKRSEYEKQYPELKIKRIEKYKQTRAAQKEARSKDQYLYNVSIYNLNIYKKSCLKCEICGKSFVKQDFIMNGCKRKRNTSCLDHNHETGNFRGCLCQSCNRNLGWYENQKQNIEAYLKDTKNFQNVIKKIIQSGGMVNAADC